MIVGICEIRLSIPENFSLKAKRNILKSIIDRTRQKFNCSIAEVGDNDLWNSALLGISVTGNDHNFINSLINKILNFIEEMNLASLEDSRFEILNI